MSQTLPTAATRRSKNLVRAGLQRVGLEVHRHRPELDEFDAETADLVRLVAPYTKTSPARVAALRSSLHYLVRHEVPGAIVECGVWRGGSVLAALHTLAELGATDRHVYLYDTFEGMVEPTQLDVRHDGIAAAQVLSTQDKRDEHSTWCSVNEASVRQNLSQVTYPPDRLHFVAGRVEDTLPGTAPDHIALLRLDTDWYESTKHELLHLVPRMPEGGILIIDDFGWWQGARRAVEEFLEESGMPIYLNRIDESGRLAVIRR